MVAPAAVVFSSTDTVLRPTFATIRSGLPSPLMSATATERGWMPVAKVVWAAKEAVVAPAPSCSAAPTPCRRVVVRDDQVGLAIAVDVRRRHEYGMLPVAKVCWGAKEGVATPGAVVFSSTDTVFDS